MTVRDPEHEPEPGGGGVAQQLPRVGLAAALLVVLGGASDPAAMADAIVKAGLALSLLLLLTRRR